jgi:WD40 repeat protein
VADLFVSYAREDQLLVRRLVDALAARGKEAWVDWEGIEPSDRWLESIREAIDEADAVVVVLSPDYVRSQVCAAELDHAAQLNKRLIPVVAADVPNEGVPETIAGLNWIFLRPEDDFVAGADLLVHALETDLDLVRTHTRVLTRARAWELAGRKPSPLLRGEELRLAEAWLARAAAGAEPQPTPLQADFIAASRRSATRRQRFAVGASLAVAALAIGLSIFAVLQRNEARDQRNVAEEQRALAQARERSAVARGLAAQSRAVYDAQPELSILLGLEGLRVERLPDTVSALVRATQLSERLVGILRGHTEHIEGLAVGPDGTTIATASFDDTVRFWDVSTRRPIGDPLQLEDAPWAVDFSPDGSAIAIGRSGHLTIHDVASRGERVEFPVSEFDLWSAVGFESTGSFLFSAGSFGRFDVWEASSAALQTTLEGHTDNVLDLAVSPDGLVATAAVDGLLLWGTSAEPARLDGHTNSVTSVAFDESGELLASASNDGTVRLWDVGAQEAFGEPLETRDDDPLLAVAISPDGGTVAAAGMSGVISLWDTAVADDTLSLPWEELRGHLGDVSSLEFLPDGRLLSAGADATVRIWNTERQPPYGTSLVADASPRAVSVAPAADRAAAVFENTGVVIWPVPAEQPAPDVLVPTTQQLDEENGAVAFSPDGAMLAAAAPEGSLRLVDEAGAQTVLLDSGPQMLALAWSADGRRLAAGDFNGNVRTWDVRGEATAMTSRHLGAVVVSLAFQRDGKLVALIADEATSAAEVIAWRPGKNEDASRWKPALDGVPNVAVLSRDGSTLAFGFPGGRIVLYDAASGQRLRELVAQREDVGGLAFSPDATVLASSGGSSGAVFLWNAQSGEPIGEAIEGFESSVGQLDFSADGETLATASSTEVILLDSILWNGDLERYRDALCPVAGRNLTHAEWRQFLPGRPYQKTCPDLPAGP